MTIALEVRAVSKSFDSNAAITDVSCSVAAGATLGVLARKVVVRERLILV